MQLFRPQIEALLVERDSAIETWQARNPGVLVYEDRKLEITSQLPVVVEDQITAVEAARRLARRRGRH